MNALIRYLTDYEATVRTDDDSAASDIIAASGGYLFSLQPQGYYETPSLPIGEARTCLENLEDAP